MFLPFAVVFFFVMILTYYWWLAFAGGLIGAVYGLAVLMRISVKRMYEQQAILQRNRFINNMTQLLTNKDESVMTAITWCAQDFVAKGEFKEDLDRLLIDLMDANDEEVKMAFQKLSDKYKNDLVFQIFVEHLATVKIEGRADIQKMKDIKSWHNDVVHQREIFMKNKKSYSGQLKFTFLFTLIIIGILTFANGFNGYLKVFAHSPIGWVTSAVFLVPLGIVFHWFQTKMADDEVMEMKIWRY